MTVLPLPYLIQREGQFRLDTSTFLIEAFFIAHGYNETWFYGPEEAPAEEGSFLRAQEQMGEFCSEHVPLPGDHVTTSRELLIIGNKFDIITDIPMICQSRGPNA